MDHVSLLLPSLFCYLFIFLCLCLFLSLSFSFYRTFSSISFHYFFIYFIYLRSFPYSFLHVLLLCHFISFLFFLHLSLFLAENYSRLQSLNEKQYQALEVPSRGGGSVIRNIYPSTYSLILTPSHNTHLPILDERLGCVVG